MILEPAPGVVTSGAGVEGFESLVVSLAGVGFATV